MKNHNLTSSLDRTIQQFVGQIVWSCTNDIATGSMLLLQIGDKIPRKQPIDNRNLHIDEVNFDGKFSLYLENCAWRLVNKDNLIVCNCFEINTENCLAPADLPNFLNSIIEKFERINDQNDLRMGLNSGYVLEVFCVNSGGNFATDDYTISNTTTHFIVGGKEFVREEAR